MLFMDSLISNREVENGFFARPLIRYSTAVIAVLAALLLRWTILRYFGGELPYFTTFYPVIMVVALLCGLWSGLLSTALAALIADYFILAPIESFKIANHSEAIALAFFVAMGVFISVVAEGYRRSQRRFAAYKREQALRDTHEQLKEVSEYHRLALDAAGLGAWDYQFDAGNVIWDERCRNGFGVASGDHFDYDACIARIHPEDRPGVDDAVKQAIDGTNGGAYHREFRVIWPDGSLHWVDSYGRVLFEGEGDQRRAVRFLGVNREITARKCAEETRAQLAAIVESSGDAIISKNLDGIVTSWNKSAQQLFGYSPEEIIGQPITLIIPPGYSAEEASFMEQLHRGEDIDHYETVRAAKDGRHIDVSVTISPVFDTSGNVIGISKILRDITERKQAEEQLRQLNRTLKARSDSNQALLHASSESEFLQEVCRIVSEDCGHAMVWIGFAENDGDKTVRPVAHAGFDEGYLGSLRITWSDDERGRGPTGTAIRAGQLSMCRNMSDDPAFLPWRKEAIERGYASSLVIPLMEDGTTFGAITIYSRVPNAFSEAEVRLLADLASDLSHGIATLRLRAARAQAEEALRQSQAQFRTLADAIPQLCWIANADGFIFWYNQRWYEYTGTTPEQMEGWGWQSVHDPNTLPKVLERWKGSIATGEPFDMVFPLRGADGIFRSFLTRVMPVKDTEGKVVRWFGTNTDISAQKEAEAALRESEERLRLFIEHAPAGLAMFDRQMRYLFASRRWSSDYGLGNRDLRGLSQYEVFPEVSDHWKEAHRRGLAGEVVRQEAERFLRADGSVQWVCWELRPWYDKAGEVGGIVIFAEDITERKRAEEALRASEQRWATTLRSIGDAVISTDSVGNIEFMNDVAERLTGWSLPEADGRHLSAVFRIMQEVTRKVPESPVAKVLRSGKVVGLANHTVLINRDGTEIPIEDSAAPIRDRSGRIEGVVLVFHDVLEQRKAEKALRVSDRLATTGRLAATIAHEIHNPLDAVSNLLFLIGHGTQEELTRQHASTASGELLRITQMTQRMLAFQREAAAPVPVKIGEILESVAALYERKLKSANINLTQQIEFDGFILALPGELRQMFANLVGNAIEAVAPRTGTITLRAYASCDWRRQRPGLRIAVADDGPGIPAEVRARIFEPFFTTKGESGTGLGLWITSEILRKYDGTLHLRTSTNPHRSGACFSIFLPFETVGHNVCPARVLDQAPS